MNRSLIIGFLGLALLFGGLLWFFGGENSLIQPKTNQKNSFSNWNSEFELNSFQPRDLGFMSELLQKHTTDSVYELNNWNQLDSISNSEKATFLFIGNNFGLESDRIDSLLKLVNKGATLIIAFDQMTQNMYDRFFLPNAFYWDYSNSLYASIGDTTLSFPLMYQNHQIYGDWYTFSPEDIIDSNFQTLAYAFDKPIAFESIIGEGKIIFHSIPRLFQNIQVYEPNGFAHASLFLNKISKTDPIIWLELGDITGTSTSSTTESEENGKGKPKSDNSLIQFILDSEALRLAFILLLVLILLFVVFRAKRKEAVLAGVPDQRNMSLAFVETLSSIYSSRQSPVGILQLLRKNFYLSINRHFFIDLNQVEEKEENKRKIVEKSSCDPEQFNALLEALDPKKNTVDEKHLAHVYREIRSFYQNSGIHRGITNYVASGKEIAIHRNLTSSAILLIIGAMSLFVGLFLLTSGMGSGVIFVLLGAFILAIGTRLLSQPSAIIFPTELVKHSLFSRKKSYSLKQGIRVETQPLSTTLHLEDGQQITFELSLLSATGRAALAQFIEHVKQKNT